VFERVGIVSKPGRSDLPGLLRSMTNWLDERGVDYECDAVTERYLGHEGGFDRAKLPPGLDLMIVLGGDGTLLSVARGVGPRETPLLAVNLGGLGFMMTTGPGEVIEALEKVFAGDYRLHRRSVLESEVIRRDAVVAKHFALNDVVVNKAAIARLLHLDVEVDGEMMCSYRADGLILSTPTGSTAYSLAAGGPVMTPSVEALCITPICPHTLSNRPVVVPESSRIETLFQGGDDTTYMTVDGQVGLNLHIGDRIRSRKAAHSVRVILPQEMRFFDVLRAKMQWGGR